MQLSRTSVSAFGSASFNRSSVTTSMCPYSAATISGVAVNFTYRRQISAYIIERKKRLKIAFQNAIIKNRKLFGFQNLESSMTSTHWHPLKSYNTRNLSNGSFECSETKIATPLRHKTTHRVKHCLSNIIQEYPECHIDFLV